MILEQIINGIVIGSMYALIALGYTLVFGVLDKLNFAHSEIFMVGGFVGLASIGLGAPIWLSLLVVPIVCGALGLLVELASFRKFTSKDAQITAALSSLAAGLIMIDAIHKMFGGEPVALDIPATVRTASISIFHLQIAWIKIGILVLAILLMIGLHLLIAHSAMGRSIRAVAESPRSAMLLGINVIRVNQQTFFIASALAGLAGLLFAMRTGFASSDVGFSFALKALAIMAIGGMGDLRGAVVGGILVGVIEALAVHFGFGRLGEGSVWALMMIILLIRPAGLFGNTATTERA